MTWNASFSPPDLAVKYLLVRCGVESWTAKLSVLGVPVRPTLGSMYHDLFNIVTESLHCTQRKMATAVRKEGGMY